MSSMCTTRPPATGPKAGFTLIELLLGLALAACLAVVAAPVWLAFENAGVQAADDTVWLLQQRVAVSRLERDLRLARADSCPFEVAGAVLEASPSQVVVLRCSDEGGLPMVVEWEMVGSALMRRCGPCPGVRPGTWKHSVYVDHKTMLERVPAGSGFLYRVRGAAPVSAVDGADLAGVEAVVVRMGLPGNQSSGGRSEGTGSMQSRLETIAWVGR